MACLYRKTNPLGRVSLVLGAGNVAAIGPMDALTKLYVEGEVCLLKMSPVNGYLGPFIEEFFSEFVRDGFLRMAYGGADVGAYLCDHPDIDDIHITGSNVTHDAIMFGTGQEGISRKRSNTPRLKKRITSELGNVSPIIVVPGPWTASDLKFHAENIATQMINNAGFNCCAAKVLVLPQQWPSSGTLMEELQAVLAAAPQRKAYYPGAEERYDRFLSANKTARPVGPRHEGVLPWTLIPDLSPGDADSICFTTESFCGVMAQTALDEADVADYLRHAIEFCNHRLWGTLSACILIHPETERRLGAEFQKSIAGLHYGAIGINHWPMLAFALGSTTWGAFPDHTYQDIQSGIGIVHNARLFDKPERTVIYGPFRVWPKPVWFITNHESHNLMPKLVDLEGKPGLFKLLGVIPAAWRG
jgi:acyl-CoA reductase-like NAD-dependent aldehyde dehydrogenase